MKRILIIGAGFAGLTAAGILGRRRGVEVLLIDRRPAQHNLPLLPDMIGRDISAAALTFNLATGCRRLGCRFLLSRIERVELGQRTVVTSDGKHMSYDWLLLAAGAVPAFYGRNDLARGAFTFDSVDAVCSLRAAIDEPRCVNAVIAGGGYTGVELATNIWRRWRYRGKQGTIYIVERSPALLGQLPDGLRRYTESGLRKLGIVIKTGVEVKAATTETIILSDGTAVAGGVLAWSAGMETPAFVRRLAISQDRQGRVVVDPYLRCAEHCFAAGDTTHVDVSPGVTVRMGVQFAIAQASVAAYNIYADLVGKPLRPYAPRDLGYIVPLATGRSCGVVRGATLYGILPTLLHYVMCVYRSASNHNRRSVLYGLWQSSRRP